MRLVAFFIVAIALKCSLALSEGEEKVINDLFQEWPVLHSVSPPWTSNASEACDVPFGGLTCSQGLEKHIIGLYDANFFFQVSISFYGLTVSSCFASPKA